LVGVPRATTTVSLPSATASSITGKLMVWLVVPGLKVRVPDDRLPHPDIAGLFSRIKDYP